ncbi:DUF6881 domain-containing protein [Amycolatopsis sp. lyj-346]|uniref:DUF6881 domain-containing protein n=1 Tax=Amycolatopsis sp. lyj-346 TaxID=2789289 RepID=UPI00397A8FC1
MEYLKVGWRHQFPDEPILLYSELDDERYETRKIEVFCDGRHQWAGPEGSVGGTVLGELPVPDTVEIARQLEFAPEVIDREEFEAVWVKVTHE